MKVVSIVGARPQFIKAAPVGKALREAGHQDFILHTGQHYDYGMSQVFFEELNIPEPNVNLEVGSGTHGWQTGQMLIGIEKVLLDEEPDWVLVYGDTNSTLAGALAAVKLHIKVAHVEAGLRSFNRIMPEEVNRVLTDHMSDLLFCPTQTAVDNLQVEGIQKGVYLVGDVMYESLLWAVEQAKRHSRILSQLELTPKKYLLTTIHRAENTDNLERLMNILEALNCLNEVLVFPVHPRTRKKIEELHWQPAPQIKLIDSVSYLEMALLEQNARVILTDSGGIQKEAHWLGVPCVTLREETEWVETVESGWNILAGTYTTNIITSVQMISKPNRSVPEEFKVSPSHTIVLRLLETIA